MQREELLSQILSSIFSCEFQCYKVWENRITYFLLRGVYVNTRLYGVQIIICSNSNEIIGISTVYTRAMSITSYRIAGLFVPASTEKWRSWKSTTAEETHHTHLP